MQAMPMSGGRGVQAASDALSRSAFAVFRDQQGASVAGAERMKQRVVRCEVRAQGRGLVGRHGIFAVSLEGYGFD